MDRGNMKYFKLLVLLCIQAFVFDVSVYADSSFDIRGWIANKLEAYQAERSADEQIGKFLYRYAAPYKVEREVDAEMTDEVKAKIRKDGFAILSSYVVKDGSRFFPDEKFFAFHRLINAVRMRRAMKHHGIDDYWTIPEKYWSTKYNMVIAKKVTGAKEIREIDPDTSAEINLMKSRTDYADWNPTNFLWDKKNRKFVLIDTGSESFNGFLQPLACYQKELGSEGAKQLLSTVNEDGFAKVCLKDGVTGTQLLRKYLKIDNIFDVTKKLEKYDDLDIDFRAIKKHLDEHGCLECNYDRYKEFFQNFDCN